MKRNTIIVKVPVPATQHEKLARYSRALGTPMVQIVNKAIREYFIKHPPHEVFDDVGPECQNNP